jgi:uncharacterized protein YukE
MAEIPNLALPTPTVVSPTVQAPTAQTVYSADNIAQAVTSPVKAPNLNDPYGLYDQFMASPEIQTAQSSVTQTQQAINQAQQALRGTTRALEDQNTGAMGTTGASVNLIGRQVGRARQLTGDELAGLGENLAAQTAYLSTLRGDAENRYNIAQQERAQLQDLIRTTSGKAGISYSDSFEDALKKASKYEEEQEKQAKKDAYKDGLKEQLQAFGSSTKGLSTKELEKKLKKKLKQAGASKAEMDDLEIALKRKELAKPYYAPKDGDSGTVDWNTANVKQGTAELIQEAKDKGLYGGYLWEYVETEAKKVGIPTYQGSDFDTQIQALFEK